MDFEKSSTIIYDCGDGHRIMYLTQDSVCIGINDSYITVMNYKSSSSSLIYGISMIQTIAQGSLLYGSLCSSPFPAPVFFLLYLLPSFNTPNMYYSLSIPSYFILGPFLPSSSLPSFYLVLGLSSCHPLVPLCA